MRSLKLVFFAAVISASGLWGDQSKPRLFKATRYPPETPEEKAMWEWWRASEKADPKFEWKMPIEFYGIVVDQFGQPVAEATVVFTWNSVAGSNEAKKNSGPDGRFEFLGERGKGVTANILKDGYLPDPCSRP